MTRKGLMAYAIGLPGFMVVKVLASAFYSKQNIKMPVKIAAVAVVLNLILNIILIHPMAHAGLALSTSIASLFNAACLAIFLFKHNIYQPKADWLWFLFRVGIAAALMAVFILWYSGSFEAWIHWPAAERVIHLILVIVISISMYFASLWLMGLRIKHFRVQDEIQDKTGPRSL